MGRYLIRYFQCDIDMSNYGVRSGVMIPQYGLYYMYKCTGSQTEKS